MNFFDFLLEQKKEKSYPCAHFQENSPFRTHARNSLYPLKPLFFVTSPEQKFFKSRYCACSPCVFFTRAAVSLINFKGNFFSTTTANSIPKCCNSYGDVFTVVALSASLKCWTILAKIRVFVTRRALQVVDDGGIDRTPTSPFALNFSKTFFRSRYEMPVPAIFCAVCCGIGNSAFFG